MSFNPDDQEKRIRRLEQDNEWLKGKVVLLLRKFNVGGGLPTGKLPANRLGYDRPKR
jgi:hypothetical protein